MQKQFHCAQGGSDMRSIKTALCFSLFLAFGCDSSSENLRTAPNIKTNQNSKVEEAKAETKPEDVKQAEQERINLTSIKLKNCDQLRRTMSMLTGVSMTNAKVVQSYNEIKGSCPTSENLDSLSPANLSLIHNLALTYCGEYSEFLVNSSELASLFQQKNPTDAFTSDTKVKLIDFFYAKLWSGEIRSDIPAKETVSTKLDELLKDIMSDTAISNNVTATKYILQGLCAPMLSASPVTTL